jgi:hypothetical protein
MRSGHVTVAIPRKKAREHASVAVLSPRQNCRDASSNRPFANDKFPFSGNQRLVSDLYTRHIRDCIERSGGTVEWDSNVACPGLCRLKIGTALRKE